MNEVRIAERVTASTHGYDAWKALESAGNDLDTAKVRLQMVLREDNPENSKEIEQMILDLQQMIWEVKRFRGQAHQLMASSGRSPTPQQAASIAKLERAGFRDVGDFVVAGEFTVVMKKQHGPLHYSGEVEEDGSVNGQTVEQFLRGTGHTAAAGMPVPLFQAKVRRIVQQIARRYGGRSSGQIATGYLADGRTWAATITRTSASNGETFGRLDVTVDNHTISDYWDWNKVFERAGIPVVDVGTRFAMTTPREALIALRIARSIEGINKFERGDLVLIHKGGKDVEVEVLDFKYSGGKLLYFVEGEKEPVSEIVLKRVASVRV